MAFLPTFKTAQDRVEKSSQPFDAGFLPSLGGYSSATGLSITQTTAMSMSVVWACVQDLSKSLARCTPSLRRISDGRGGEIVTDHPVADIIKRPNRIQTWFEFACQMQMAFKLRQNAYAIILRDKRGNPTGLVPVNPDAVVILEAPGGEIFYQVARQSLFEMDILRDLPLAIPAEDVFHLRGLSFNMLYGLSTLASAKDSIGIGMGLEQQAARFMKNAARPAGVLQTDKSLTEAAAKRLKDQWESMKSGIGNYGSTAILENGLKWTPMQLTSVDLEFVAQRRFAIEDIARWFAVPLHRINVSGELGKTKQEDADQAYVNAVIMPDCEAWEQKFDMVFDLSADGLFLDLDERNLLRASETTRINNGRLAIMSGIKNQNEVRKDEGLPPVEGGDVLLRPLNLAALGSDVSGTAPDGAGRPSGQNLPDPGAANVTSEEGTTP